MATVKHRQVGPEIPSITRPYPTRRLTMAWWQWRNNMHIGRNKSFMAKNAPC